MNNAFAEIGMNPFEKDIIEAPSDVSFSVSGLNDKPLMELVARFEALTANATLPRPQTKAQKAQLVISPDAGFGKSHLLGRLFKKLGDRATLVYIRPFQAPQRAWHSILQTTIKALRSTVDSRPSVRCQLDAFALGVLAHLAADHLAVHPKEGAEPKEREGLESHIKYLREHPLEVLSPAGTDNVLISWLKSALDDGLKSNKLAGLVGKRGVDLQGREKAWLKVLSVCAFSDEYSEEREVALKWLRAEPLEDEEVELLNLTKADNEGKEDSSTHDINALSLQRLRGLCALSAYFRPFVFCFDQTENYASDRELSVSFGQCIEVLYAEIFNHLTIVTANASNWNELRSNLHQPHRDRFSPVLELEGIKIGQAKDLMISRLRESNLDEAYAGKFLSDSWLNELFKNEQELGVRKLISAAAQRFRSLANIPEAPKLSLDELFTRQVNEVRALEALNQYNEDCLVWFVQELIKGHNDVTVTKTTGNKYFSVSWEWPDVIVSFAFEEGDHHGRWKAIAKEALSLSNGQKRRATIVFRTPDLPNVPKPTWHVVRPQIDAAGKKGFRIVQLKLEEVYELHAAREFYSNAIQGNLDYPAHEVMPWLRTRFADFFQRYSALTPPEATSPTSTAAVKQQSFIHDLTEEQLGTLTSIVKQMKLVDVNHVIVKLGIQSSDAVLRAVEKNPNLKAHPGPKTIFLQWRTIV